MQESRFSYPHYPQEFLGPFLRAKNKQGGNVKKEMMGWAVIGVVASVLGTISAASESGMDSTHLMFMVAGAMWGLTILLILIAFRSSKH
jgi:hypothetical protein